ncbi:tyrosine-type recombinase/integrase [Limosilactobacillus sp.]|uniref:tyrosine-type recombinase/integrase n=1 Tax=Limosilactobacillus sp. TaxID=2773925 RepID=UPI00345EBBA4
MASYYKYQTAKGQRWYVKYSKPNGKQSSKRGFKTKSAAQKWLRTYMVDIDHYGNAENMTITFAIVYKKWLPAYAESVVDTTAHKTKQIFKNHILPALGSYPVADISVPLLQRLVNHWDKILVKNDCALYTNLVLRRAVQLGYIHTNPMNSVIQPKKKARPAINNYFNQQEFKEFLTHIKADYQPDNPRAFMMLWLAAATGMRRGEILALEWNCVDFKHNVIQIKRSLKRATKSYIGSPKNKSSVRKIAVDETTMNYLHRWKHQQHKLMIYFNFDTYKIKNQLVFSTYRKNKPMPEAAADKYINHITKKYGMKHVTFHGLRHTHATLLVEHNTNVKTVSERLGHSSMETTLRVYVNMDKQPNHKVANTFENLMN